MTGRSRGPASPTLLLGLLLAALPGRPARADDVDARRLVAQNCGCCHSEDMIAQQRLTPEQWEKVLTKMGTFGVVLEKDDQAAVREYLVRSRGPGASRSGPERVLLLSVAWSRVPRPAGPDGEVEGGREPYARACAICHGPHGEGATAPALLRRPVLTRVREFERVVREGLGRMPAYAGQLTSEEIRNLRAFLVRASRS